MTDALLLTKLHRPRLRTALVPRPRLISKLNRGLRCKLTLVSAPAGFGKTTLISSWLDGLQESPDRAPTSGAVRVAWLSLDERDGDPTRFLIYFVAALQPVLPDLDPALLSDLRSPQPPPADTVITAVLNAVARAAHKILLVLDDFHLLDAPAVDQALILLLQHLPQQMHLVITTREDPQLSLSRLRARGLLSELRAADLRFSTAEAAAFLNQVMELNLAAADVAALETRTEGWIAGLQLAALALEGPRPPLGAESRSEFIHALAGDNRYIVDYLVDEVLQRQPDALRRFLLQTSILARLSGPLCNAVTEQTNSGSLLESLERSNLFVISLDDKRRWYRYHHLFAAVLHAHLRREQPEALPALHRRASAWYEQNGAPADAIRHALAAPDFDRAAALIERGWPAIRHGFRPALWLSWVQALPDAVVGARPVLNVGAAWTLLDAGQLEEAALHLDRAARLLRDRTARSGPPAQGPPAAVVFDNTEAWQTLPASMASARAYLALAQDDAPAAVKNAGHALELFPENAHYQRGLAAMFLGLALWSDGDLEPASRAMTDGMVQMRLADDIYFQVVATGMLADIQAEQGRLREAAATYERSLRLAEGHGGLPRHETSDQHVGLSELHREWNDLALAAQYLEQRENLGGMQAILPGSASRRQAAMARIRVAEGSLVEALDLLHVAERLYRRDPRPDTRPVAALRAHTRLRQGRLAAALEALDRQGLSATPDYGREFAHLALARTLIAQFRQERREEDVRQATALLAHLLAAAEAGGRMRAVIEILVLQALAHQAQGKMDEAVAVLTRALTMAQPEGYVRLFVAEGPPMRELLAASLAQGVAPAYVTGLLQVIDPRLDEAAPPPDPNQLLPEPLTDRELEVLGLLAGGLSNQDIADELVIALSTVKKHVNNIFGKLNVTSRTQAVSRARELKLL